MANPVANIQIGVNLIDDYLYLEETPVQQDLGGRFVTVHNPAGTSPTSELLTVNGEGHLVHFMADPASNSGWATTVVTKCVPPTYGDATSDTIARLAGYYDAGGILNVLAYYPTGTEGVFCATWMQRATDGTWANATDIMSGTTKNSLALTLQTDVWVDSAGNGYFYGVSGSVGGGAFFIASYDAGKNAIDVLYSYALTEFPPQPDGLGEQAAFRLAPGTGSDGMTVLWVATPAGTSETIVYHQGATITQGRLGSTFAWSGGEIQPSVFQPNLGLLSVSDLVCLPGDYGADALLLRDGENGLWLVQGYNAGTPTMTALSGAAATQPAGALSVAAGYDSTGAMTLFAIESGGDDNLWYVQQASPSATLDPTGWVNLGGEHFAIGTPDVMVAGPELFSAEYGASGPTVYHMDRSLSNPVWSTRKVAAPLPASGPPTNIASYTMEVTTLDTYGNIVPSTRLQVTADQAATVIWNLVAYHVGPNTPIPVQTDANGQASVQLQCDSLKPPVVTFSATVGQSIVSRWCQGDVVQVMNEQEALPPLSDSVAPTLQNVDGQTLMNQQLFSSEGYDNQSDALTAANNTAQAINATGAWMTGNPSDPTGQGLLNTTGIETPHWQLDFTHPEGPRFRVLSLEEARDIVRRSRAGSTPPLLGGSLGSVFGDVAHFFKKEWQKLHKFSSSLENDVLTVTLEAEEGTQSFVINTVKEAGAALETVFAQIKQIADDIYGVIAEVVAWLKMLFEWDDILNTQKAINACVTQTIANIEATVNNNDAQAAVNKWISELKADIAGYFAQLESVFDSQTSYNSYANAAGQPSTSGPRGAKERSGAKGLSDGTNILAATPTQNAHRQHASKCNYVYSKTKTHYASSTSTVALVGAPADSGVQPIIDAVLNNICGDAFDNAVATINAQLQTLASNPGAIFDMIIIDFLTAAQAAIDVILDGMEAVLDAVIQVATDTTVDLFELLDGFLQTPITIPVVSWLWTTVIDPNEPFNMLNLISLIGAVITTILYKVLQIDGGNPPFSSDVSGEITGNLPWPALPGATLAPAGATEAAPAASALSSTALAGTAHTGAGLADASGMMPLQGLPPMGPVPPKGGAPGPGIPWGSTPPAWSTPLAYVGAGLMFLNGLVAAEVDLYAYDNAVIQEESGAPPPPNPSFQFWSVVSLVFGVMIAGSGAPYKAIYGEPKTGSDGVTIAYWGSNILRTLVDIIFTICGPQLCKVEGCPTWGPQCKTALGCLSLALAVTNAVVSKVENTYSPWATANMVIRPISPVAKFMLMGTNSTAVMFLMLLEAFLGIGAGVTQAEKTA